MSEPEEYQELSLQERFELASNFLLDAPPGEINDVIRDVTGFFQEEEQLEPYLINKLKQYNNENFVTVETEDKNKVLITQFNCLEDDVYYCPNNKKKFRFEPVSHNVEWLEEYVHDEQNESLRQTLQTGLEDYQMQHYPNGSSCVFSDKTKLILVIYGLKLSQKNYWNGRLKATWTYNLETQELKGIMLGNVHYYEEGNVQLHSNKEFSFNLENVEDEQNIVSSVIKKIQSSEHQYQLALNEGYLHLNENAFKGLRRHLPVTRSKIDWSQIFSYKIGSEINK